MTPEEAEYRFAERLAIMTENGQSEAIAVQTARREVFDALKGELGIQEASKFVGKLYRWDEKEIAD